MMRRFLCCLTCSLLLVGCMPHAAPEMRPQSQPVSRKRITPPHEDHDVLQRRRNRVSNYCDDEEANARWYERCKGTSEARR